MVYIPQLKDRDRIKKATSKYMLSTWKPTSNIKIQIGET